MKTDIEQIDWITLKGEEVPLKIKLINQYNLKFFPENPRIYSIVSAGKNEPTQEEIQKALIKRDHVKQLIQSIKANGGLTDPIFVREDNLIVLEGNSRLAAYRALAEQDAIKWGQIKCKLLPKNIDEEKIFSLLGEYHIIGKQDWAPFEQAGYLYRRQKNHGITSQKMGDDLGISTRKVNHLIDVYAFMLEHNDRDPWKWSYYDEYLKSRSIAKIRKANVGMDKLIVKNIKNGDICKAREIRDDLPKIIKAGKKVIKDYLSGEKNFRDSVERAIAIGVDDTHYNQLKKFKNWIVSSDMDKEVSTCSKEMKDKIHFEIKKIKNYIEQIEKLL